MATQENVTIAAVRAALQALGDGGREITYGLLYETLGVNCEAEKARIRSRISGMVEHGEVTRAGDGRVKYVFEHRPRQGRMHEIIWRYVRAAKPGWSLQDCALMTRASYTHVLRYMAWLEKEGFIKRAGRNERNAILYRNTPKALASPETPYPPTKEADPFAEERKAAASITRLMLCGDPYAAVTARQITKACQILLARFGGNDVTELENGEKNHVE